MAKNKSIETRPMIIVSLTTTKWNVERRKDTKELVIVSNSDRNHLEDTDITTHRIIKVKPETAATGRYRILTDRWYGSVVLPDASVKRVYECHLSGIKQTHNSLTQAFATLEKALKKRTVSYEGNVVIERVKETYYNPVTKQTTSDRKEAEGWFKGKNPLFVSSSQYQKIGIWLNPGSNYVEVNFYYNNRIQRERCESWTKAKVGGFRLYNDGTISHFFKGKVYDQDRIFETKRVHYRTLDIRFKEQYRLSTLALDLRSPELIGSDSMNRRLCKESLKILEKAGFPKEYWCWGNTRRPFRDTYDLINFVTHIQHKNQTKRGSSMDEFLADKPFGPQHENVFKFKKGVIIRIPGYRELWVDKDGRHYDHRPSSFEALLYNCQLLKVEIYERYRIWISDNGKTRSCQELIHDGTCWSQCRWDGIRWPEPNSYDHHLTNDTPAEYRAIQLNGLASFKEFLTSTYANVYKLLPVLTRFESFVSQHPDLTKGIGLCNFLDSIYRAPKLTETLIKLGYGDWFYKRHDDRYDNYYPDGKIVFTLEHALSRFGIRYTTSYNEIAGNTMYKNLGVSKEQFKWLAEYINAGCFMQYFKDYGYIIPNTNNEHYSDFAAIPVKYLKILATAVENANGHALNRELRRNDYWGGARRVQSLLDYGYTVLDVEKALNRGLDLQLLSDYLRMRSQCGGANNFNIRDWDKLPTDQTDLRFCHDRICAFYNLMMAERERYWREEEEKRMIERQKQYVDRYKKLKSLTYTEEEDSRTIVVPQKLVELVVEGQILHHCVGSFANSVAEGRDTIVFLRDKSAPSTPYATISLLKAGDKWKIDQAHTAHNGPISEEDVAFLKRWGAKNNVDLLTIKTHYGAHCHH